MKKNLNVETQSILFTFDEGLDPVKLSMTDVSPENATYAMLHGFMQRLGDAAAISRNQKDGTVITVTEKMRRDEVLAMRDFYANPTNKDWTMKATGPRAAPQNPVILAIAAKLGISYEAAQAKVAEQFLADLDA